MTDVLVYDKVYRLEKTQGGSLRWHSNHRVFADLLPGDRLWVVTSGKSLGREDESTGYVVAMWPIQQIIDNPGDDPEFPARKFGHRVLVNQTEALHLDQPVSVDHIIRGEGYDQSISVGRFLRGPRRLSDEKVRQLLSAAGADMAQKWLLGNKKPPTPVGGSAPSSNLKKPPTPVGGSAPSSNLKKPPTPVGGSAPLSNPTAVPTAPPASETPDASRREPSFPQRAWRPPFQTANMQYAYQLHYHIGFRTRHRVPVFERSSRNDALREILPTVCQRSDYHILELDVEHYWTRLLISLKPSDSPAKTVQTIKANSSRLLFAEFPEIEREVGRRSLWSRGYYVRGVGDVPNRVVLEYIARQKEHHEIEMGDSVHLGDFAHPHPKPFLDLRPFSHCMAEYNCHFVCCPVGHVGAIDRSFAEPLIEYILRVAVSREFDVIRVSVLADHIHLFAALKPHQAPEDLALSLMNNTSHWFRRHNPGAFKVWDIPGFWTCSAFLRTAGAATTNQVRYHLKGKEMLLE